MKTVRIYYDDVQVHETPYEVYEGCKYVDIDRDIAEEYADQKLNDHEWSSYLIPEMATDHNGVKAGTIFHPVKEIDFSGWTTSELFDYASDNGLVEEEAVFEDWMHNRTDLYDMVVEHYQNSLVIGSAEEKTYECYECGGAGYNYDSNGERIGCEACDETGIE